MCRDSQMALLSVSIIISLSALATGCESLAEPAGGGPQEPLEPLTALPRSLSAAEAATIAASNEFGLDLLNELATASPTSTVFISPLSVSMALGMTLNGADGATFDEMRTALGFDGLSERDINHAYSDLIELLRGLDGDVDIQIANAVWYRSDYTPVPDFAQRVRSYFDAAMEALGDDPAAQINSWVRDATNGAIDGLTPPPLPANLVAALMNAVYFNADWSESFDPARTAPAPFHKHDGSTVDVQLMRRTATTGVWFDAAFAAADIPYGREAFSMTIVVPREASVHDVLEDLDGEAWASLTASFVTAPAIVEMPRFELEWQARLDTALAAMGMPTAFTPQADFSRMFEAGGIWINEVRQKTFLRVDEEGTEAAAVTSVGVSDFGPPHIRADRPFLLAIRERFSGTILFLGVIVDPPQD